MIFDVDGTLVDSQNLIVAAQREAFAAHGLEPPTRARSLSVVGLSLVEAFTDLVGAHGPAESLAEAYKAAFHRLRADPANAEPLFPGAAEALDRFEREGFLLGIATGKSRRGVAHLVERHGWRDRFATVQTADDAPSKPHPAMILQALAETGADPAESAMLGDTTFDVQMALSGGIGAVGVAWGYHPAEALRGAGAQAMAASFAEAFDAVRTLVGGSRTAVRGTI